MQTNLAVARLHDHHLLMLRIRAFERQGIRAQREGLIHGPIHAAIGQEAVAVGVCAHLRRTDLLVSNHRGHGHTLAKGGDSTRMMGELFGRVTGPCRGKGGSVHLADFEVGMLGANGVIGANIEIATGAAQAILLKGEERIVVCMLGDGAINRGPFFEGLNWARIFDLPVLFVCEDNGFAASTRTDQVTGGPGVVARAEALGVPACAIDGNDILMVDDAVGEAVAAIRAGEGPRLIHARTYRLEGHSATDAARYRSREEVEVAWRNDPIRRSRELLLGAGVEQAVLERAEAETEAEMAMAYRAAAASPWPNPAEAFDDVQHLSGLDRRNGRHG